jgi:hypothetical protein
LFGQKRQTRLLLPSPDCVNYAEFQMGGFYTRLRRIRAYHCGLFCPL